MVMCSSFKGGGALAAAVVLHPLCCPFPYLSTCCFFRLFPNCPLPLAPLPPHTKHNYFSAYEARTK